MPYKRPAYVEAAETFRQLLGNDSYPVGYQFAGVNEIMKVCGVTQGTAYKAMHYLVERGELAATHGIGVTVLEEPAESPRRLVTDALKQLDDLRSVLVRLADELTPVESS